MLLNLSEKKSLPDIIVLLIYAAFVLILIYTTKTVFAGYQLTDDQIQIGYDNRVHLNNFLPSVFHEIKDELFLRFRPLTVINYIFIAKFLYPNFFLLAVTIALEGIFACYFFYRFAKALHCSFWVSFLFPLFILCGNQGVIFWRNCVNETLGMLLLSLSLFFLGNTYKSNKFYSRNVFFFAFFLLLTTLTKESFIILIPAIIFFKIWQDWSHSQATFYNSIKSNLKLIIFFTLVIIIEIWVIYYYKSISNHFIDYVAIDKETLNLSNLFISFYRLTITKGYLIIIFPALLFIYLKRKTIYSQKYNFRNFWLPLSTVFLLIIIPQILLYAKSLIFERYLLPGTLGCAILIILLQQYIERNNERLRILKLFLPICTLLLCSQIFLMIKGAKLYAAAGLETRTMLQTIIKNTKINDTVLVVATPLGQSDKSLAVKEYLQSAIGGGRKNIFIQPIFDSITKTTPVTEEVIKNFDDATQGIKYSDIKKKENIKCILLFANTKELFFKRYTGIDTNQYNKLSAGNFIVYFNKN